VTKLKAFNVAPFTAPYPPALIIGGGYDPAEDALPVVAANRTMGRAVYIVNGDDGSPYQVYGIGESGANYVGSSPAMSSGPYAYAIPSDITAINTDFDAQGFADRLVFGTLGGYVWRIDVDDPVQTNWKGMLLADLSDTGAGANNPNGEKRKFFFPPAVAPQEVRSVPKVRVDAVYIGSGDKEHPLNTNSAGGVSPYAPFTTSDRMFMFMDNPALNANGLMPNASGAFVSAPVTLGGGTLEPLANGFSGGVDFSLAANDTKQGWMMFLDDGEKVVNAPTVFQIQSQFSLLRFGTYAPTGTSLGDCTPPGDGRLNEVNAVGGSFIPGILNANGAPSRYFTDFISRGYMSSTQLVILPSGGPGSAKQIFQFNCADANCRGSNIGTLGVPTKIYWYMEPEQ
jgi:type IV pilus assembly protein PilY1